MYGFVFYAYLIVDMPYNLHWYNVYKGFLLLILIKCVNLLILCLQTNLLPTSDKRKIIKGQLNGCVVNCMPAKIIC